MARSFRPMRCVPLGVVVAGMLGLQVLVIAAAVALRLPLFRGGN